MPRIIKKRERNNLIGKEVIEGKVDIHNGTDI